VADGRNISLLHLPVVSRVDAGAGQRGSLVMIKREFYEKSGNCGQGPPDNDNFETRR
jgi:hypothetical protein